MIGSSERGSSIVKRNSLCLLALVQEMQVLKKGGGGGGRRKGYRYIKKPQRVSQTQQLTSIAAFGVLGLINY